MLFLLRNNTDLIRIVSLIIFGAWVYRLVLYYILRAEFIYMYNAFDSCLDALMIGGLLAIIVEQDVFQKARQMVLCSPWLVAAPICLLILVCIRDGKNTAIHSYLFWAQFSLQPVVIGVLLLQVVHWSASSWNFLESKAVKLIARLSYALYLYHPISIQEASRLFAANQKLYAATATILLAIGSYYAIECPMLKIRDRRT